MHGNRDEELETVRLPVRRASTNGSNWRDTLWWRIREWLGRTANALGLPGAIAEAEFVDDLTGQQLRVRVGSLFVVLRVNGRDYYFWRFSGRHDGAGSAVTVNSHADYSEV